MKQNKAYIFGLSIGTLWLIVASTGFSVSLLATAGRGFARIALVAEAVIAIPLLAASFFQILAAGKLPKDDRPRSARRKAGRRFMWIVILEILGIFAINGIVYFAGLLSWLVPVDLIIVGVHFIPLAKLFSVPRYTWLGVAFCVIPVLTLVFVASDAQIGDVVARYLISSLGCAAAAWGIAAGNMLEIGRLLTESRSERRSFALP